MHVANFRGAQLRGKRLAIELRVVARPGNTANVDDALDAVRTQQLEQIFPGAVGVPNRKNFKHCRVDTAGSLRYPVWMAGEYAVDVAHFVNDEDAEGDAEQSGGDGKTAIEARETCLAIFERQSDRGGNQHHPGNRAKSKYKKIDNC